MALRAVRPLVRRIRVTTGDIAARVRPAFLHADPMPAAFEIDSVSGRRYRIMASQTARSGAGSAGESAAVAPRVAAQGRKLRIPRRCIDEWIVHVSCDIQRMSRAGVARCAERPLMTRIAVTS